MSQSHDYDKILTRLTIVLNRLYEGEELSVTDLAEEFNVSKKTIQRDFNERLYRFPIEKSGRKWRMMAGYRLERQRSADEMLVLDILEKISEGISPKFLSRTQPLFAKLRNESENPIYAHVSIEDVSDKAELFGLLEKAIRESVGVKFEYKNKMREVEPYRLVNFEGYWYLLGVEKADRRAKTYYLKEMYRVQVMEDEFLKDDRLDDILKGALNAWFEPDKEPFEVKLLADSSIAKYFHRRPVSPKQKLLATHENGSLEIAVPITSEQEILPVLKYWMPHLTVLEPVWLREKMVESCQNWLKKLQNATGHDVV